MRRLAALSVLLVFVGLLLLVPNSALYNLITTGSASGSVSSRFAAVSGTSNTSTYESLLGFGLIGVGAVLEFLSLFTDGGASPPTRAEVPASVATTAPSVSSVPVKAAQSEEGERP